MQKGHTKKTEWARSGVVGSAIALFVCVGYFGLTAQTDLRTVKIHSQELHVNIATSSQDKQKGLCCRDGLPADEGMLFVFNKPGFYAFWMKDTRIPLDMFWINSDKLIVHIEKSVQPGSYPKSFVSSEPATYVLETNAGYADRYQIKNRDKVAF